MSRENEAMSQENVEVARRMLDAFNRDDVEAVIAAFDEDCEIREPPEMPDSPVVGYRGHAGIREWMGNLRGVAGAGFEPRHFEPRDDSLLCELASTGHGHASGVRVEWMTYAVFEMRGGKITRIRVFLSRAQADEAVGLSE
jgi:ketosteroid isomerase-like protein